jgi:hypothetical protein
MMLPAPSNHDGESLYSLGDRKEVVKQSDKHGQTSELSAPHRCRREQFPTPGIAFWTVQGQICIEDL